MSTPRTLFVERVALGTLALDADESHYARDVLRMAVGEEVTVVDGRGGRGEGTVGQAPGRTLVVHVGVVAATSRPGGVVVLLGLPKPALVDEAVQLGTEAGLAELWLFPVGYSPPGRPRLDRLNRIARAATRQCRRDVLPAIRLFDDCTAALTELKGRGPFEPSPLWLATPPAPPGTQAANATGWWSAPAGSRTVVAIGPEAGFTTFEVEIFLAAGFTPTSLGPNVLRAPTAVAIATALCLCGAPPLR